MVDYSSIHGSPALGDKTGLEYSDVSTEFRWHFLEHDAEPIGLALSFAPNWRRTNDSAPGQGESFSMPVTLLVDKDLIRYQLYAIFNATLEPTFNKLAGGWRALQPMELSAAVIAAVGVRIVLGGEILPQLSHNEDGIFASRALYAGSTLLVRSHRDLTIKAA